MVEDTHMETKASSEKHLNAMRHASWISLIVSASLLVMKYIAFWVSGSQAVYSDAAESVVNVVAALGALLSIRISLRPIDGSHPYGYGKVEYFSAAFEGGLLFFAGLVIAVQAIESWVRGPELRELSLGLILVACAGLINLALGLYLKRAGEHSGSLALVASGSHVISDFWTSFGVLVGLGLVMLTGVPEIDAGVAFLVGGHLLFAASKVLRESARGLLDERDPKVLERIRDVFLKHAFPGVIQIHHTRVLRSGSRHHIDTHIVIPEFWSVSEAHAAEERFEKSVTGSYGLRSELHVHLDPCRRLYCAQCDLEACPVRQAPFVARKPWGLDELTSPLEPVDQKGQKKKT